MFSEETACLDNQESIVGLIQTSASEARNLTKEAEPNALGEATIKLRNWKLKPNQT